MLFRKYFSHFKHTVAQKGGTLTIRESVAMWFNEYKDYDFCANKNKNPPAMIGHYTAMVWNETTHVGCGWAECVSFGLWIEQMCKRG